MIYLASPYSHPDKNVMNRRYVAAVKATAELMRRGVVMVDGEIKKGTSDV